MHPLLARNLKQTIKAGELALTPLPLCPTISLYLISDDYPTGRLPQDEMLAIIDKPAYWAFCWASGQVLAGYITQHPEICRDKSVLDLGSGSGVVAIAAAQAGATNVIACDIDAHALDATRVNAEQNKVEVTLLTDLAQQRKKVDLLIAADVLYDQENLAWLDVLQNYAHEVLIADSRMRDHTVFNDYEMLEQITATTIPDLDELKEYGHVSIYHRRYSGTSD